MTPLLIADHKMNLTESPRLSWKALIRRIFERMGEQYAFIPNML
jgi:hypothetical protein